MTDYSDIIFVIMDVMIMILMLGWIRTSRKVEIEARPGSKIVISCMFFGVAVLTFVRYTGWIRYVQTIVLVLIGVLFYLVKSGICDTGVVVTGVFTPWSRVGQVSFNRSDSSISFEVNHKPVRLYFKAEQMDQIRMFLSTRANKH